MLFLMVLASVALAAEPDGWAERQAAGVRPIEVVELPAPPSTLVVGATVLTAAGERLEGGWVLMRDGRIADVGDGARPAADRVVEAPASWFVTPGIIDTHSHLGVYPSPDAKAHADGNEMTRPVTPGVWAEHGVWPADPGFQRAVAGGVTTLQVLPGSANLIGGRGVVLRPLPTRGGRAMRFPGAPETVKMACGENPKRVYGEKGGPATRMGNLHGQRQAFLDAKSYGQKWADAAPAAGKRKKDEPAPTPPDQDLDKDTLVGLMNGQFLAQVHCYRADDMLSFLQLADEMGFQVRSFHHAVEAYKIRDVLAARGVSVSTWSDWWGFKMEAFDAVLPNVAMLSSAGARAIVHSDSPEGIQRLNQEAGKAWRDGQDAGFAVSEDEALRWITANPAWALGIDGETGTLEAGKRADLVLWDAHPFSVYARARKVFIDGRLVLDADHPETWSDFEIGQEVSP